MATGAVDRHDDFFRAVTEHATDLLMVLERRSDGRFAITWVSGSVGSILGMDVDTFLAADDSDLIHPDDLETTRTVIQTFAAGPPGESVALRYRLHHEEGRWLNVEAQLTNRLHDPRIRGIVYAVRDVTERRLFDPHTGLPNRTLLLDRIGQLVGRRREGPRHRYALLVVGLDRYSEARNAHGQADADLMVEEIARRILDVLRPSDTVARLQADEIAVLLTEPGDDAQLELICRRINRAGEQPVSLEDSDAFSPLSTGIAVDAAEFVHAQQVLDAAAAAMIRSRIAGSSASHFKPGMGREARARVGLEAALTGALGRDELTLHYQPIVELRSGAIAGYEALVRWRHDRRWIPPSEFIPLAERSDMICDLGAWVLHRACAEAAAHPDIGTISVNLSARELRDPSLPERIAGVLEATNLAPERLELELTETAIAHEPLRAAEALARIRRLGVRIAVDDFGTGHASLQQLLEYPFDTLKIDRSFITGLAGGGGSAAIVPAVLGMARSLELTVIAEGIETTAQLEHLQGLDCALGQGFLFARPGPAEDAFG